MMPVQLAPHPPGRPATRWPVSRDALSAAFAAAWRPVLLSWLAARVVVLLVLGATQLLAALDDDLRTDGLLGWDARWYHLIAAQGYEALPEESVRFFPLLPGLARLLSPLVLGREGAALLLLSNASAVLFGLLLHRLVVREGLGTRVADRAVWAAAFAPAAFVNVMGYTEPLYGALTCGLLLALQDRRWDVVALLGLLAGALRPPGVVLAAVVAVVAVRGLAGAGPRELAARAAAVAAPAAGLASYLLWTGVRTGDPLLPFRVQVEPDLRGGAFVDPLPGIVGAVRGLLTGHLEGAGLHVLWAGVALVLLVVVARSLPPPYLVLGGLTVLLALTARSMTSFERYALNAVPLLVAAAIVTGSPRVRRVTLVAGPLVLAAYAAMAFLHLYVP